MSEFLPGDIIKHIDGRVGVFSNYRDQPEMGGHVVGVFFHENRERRSVSQIIYCRFKDLSVIGSIHNRWAAFSDEELEVITARLEGAALAGEPIEYCLVRDMEAELALRKKGQA
jgi:hypothetical protein